MASPTTHVLLKFTGEVITYRIPTDADQSKQVMDLEIEKVKGYGAVLRDLFESVERLEILPVKELMDTYGEELSAIDNTLISVDDCRQIIYDFDWIMEKVLMVVGRCMRGKEEKEDEEEEEVDDLEGYEAKDFETICDIGKVKEEEEEEEDWVVVGEDF